MCRIPKGHCFAAHRERKGKGKHPSVGTLDFSWVKNVFYIDPKCYCAD